MNHLFFKHVATQGLVGYGYAPGTMATLMMIPLVWYLGSLHLSIEMHFLMLLVFFAAAWYVVIEALNYFSETDPAAIVIDEMVSFLFVFVGVPVTLKTVFIGFVCFRLLDIYKPLGISQLDSLPGAEGIMLDDFAAAFLSNLLLQGLFFFGIVL